MLQQKLSKMTSSERIMHVKRQIHVWKLQHKYIHNKVYHDQLDELYTVLDKLEKADRAQTIDPLEKHCESHPGDGGCREYDV